MNQTRCLRGESEDIAKPTSYARRWVSRGVIGGGEVAAKLPEVAGSCRKLPLLRQFRVGGGLWCYLGSGAGDGTGIGVCGLRDGGFRRISRCGWKRKLEQPCRWSGNLAARLFFEQVQKAD